MIKLAAAFAVAVATVLLGCAHAPAPERRDAHATLTPVSARAEYPAAPEPPRCDTPEGRAARVCISPVPHAPPTGPQLPPAATEPEKR